MHNASKDMTKGRELHEYADVNFNFDLYLHARDVSNGYFAYKRTSNLTDYMLGGRTLGPAVTALSAGASDMSGWLLMGLPGAMFSVGLSSSWIAIGLTLGAYANWLMLLLAYVPTQKLQITLLLSQNFWNTVSTTNLICYV